MGLSELAMDYDKTSIADSYDSGRGYHPDILQQWLDLLSAHMTQDQVSYIIDLGCGTGRYTEPLAAHFCADVLGIDPSEKMLAQARRKQTDDRVAYQRAPGEELPVSDGSADMVFMSMIFHHLHDPQCTARECHRVLRQQGCVCLRNATVDAIETFPYLRFFPTIRSLIEEHLPERDQIRCVFEEAGLQTIAHEIVPHQMSTDWVSFADKMSLRADSFLARIPDDEFDAGITTMREYAQNATPDQPVVEDVDFFVFQR